ncbi:MAG TPA: hypothetical protein VM597_29240, partial [Gemmataceae bacterium]|nr:hypothetical protein [Gemmataceae bacterium]
LIERGLSVEDVERLTETGAWRPRSVLEQFAALSGGAKAGIIIGGVLVANMVMAATIAATTGHGGVCSVNYVQVATPPPQSGSTALPMPAAAAVIQPAEDDEGC